MPKKSDKALMFIYDVDFSNSKKSVKKRSSNRRAGNTW